jgi:hypothetical protein
MFDQEDEDLRIVLGVVCGVIALVIGLVIGLGVYQTHRVGVPGAAVVSGEEAFAEVEPQGEALVAAERVLLRKPAVTLGGGTPEAARRVEIRVQ